MSFDSRIWKHTHISFEWYSCSKPLSPLKTFYEWKNGERSLDLWIYRLFVHIFWKRIEHSSKVSWIKVLPQFLRRKNTSTGKLEKLLKLVQRAPIRTQSAPIWYKSFDPNSCCSDLPLCGDILSEFEMFVKVCCCYLMKRKRKDE